MHHADDSVIFSDDREADGVRRRVGREALAAAAGVAAVAQLTLRALSRLEWLGVGLAHSPVGFV
jgi:hypothetical protein